MRAARQPSQDQISLSEILYALSDPARLDIVRGIAEDGEQACNQCPVEMPKSSLSHHFKVLRQAGVISTRIEGTRHFNSLRVSDLNARFPGLLTAILKGCKHQ